MNIEYVGIKNINGPLMIIEGVKDACFDEIVTITCNNKEKRLGRIIQLEGDVAVVQVFEGTEGLSLENTRSKLSGSPMKLPVSKELLGRIFDGAGRPKDSFGEVIAEQKIDINGQPINPVSREYPHDFIQTGISSIDTLATLIKGQKLPIFSGLECTTTNSQYRLSSKQLQRTQIAELSLLQWVSKMTLHNILHAVSKKVAHCRRLQCF